MITIDQALTAKTLLGAALRDPIDSWATWRVVFKAAFALPLTAAERKLFKKLSGDRTPPKARRHCFFAQALRAEALMNARRTL
jgi:hypothetical protein